LIAKKVNQKIKLNYQIAKKINRNNSKKNNMIIFLYILGVTVAILAMIFVLMLENQVFKRKVTLKIVKLKKNIPLIKHWDEESILRQIQQRLFLAGMIVAIGFGFVLSKLLF
jgi:glycopeptide antibiotics resistance protein